MAALLTLALILLSLLHVYFVTAFDTATALAVLAVIEPTKALQIALMSSFPAAMTGYALVYGPRFALVRGREYWTPPRLLLGIVLFTLAFPFIAASSPLGIALILGSGVAVGLTERRELVRTGTVRAPVGPASRAPLWTFVVLASLSMVLTQQWAPLEQLTVSTGPPVVGRVMGEQAGQLLLLNRHAEALWVHADDVTGRRLCRVDELGIWPLEPISTLVAGRPHYKKC